MNKCKQCDELLVALQGCLFSLERSIAQYSCCEIDDIIRDAPDDEDMVVILKARTAIAKAKGE